MTTDQFQSAKSIPASRGVASTTAFNAANCSASRAGGTGLFLAYRAYPAHLIVGSLWSSLDGPSSGRPSRWKRCRGRSTNSCRTRPGTPKVCRKPKSRAVTLAVLPTRTSEWKVPPGDTALPSWELLSRPSRRCRRGSALGARVVPRPNMWTSRVADRWTTRAWRLPFWAAAVWSLRRRHRALDKLRWPVEGPLLGGGAGRDSGAALLELRNQFLPRLPGQ